MQPRSNEFKAHRLDLQAFARADGRLDGTTPLSTLPRLRASAHGRDDPEAPPVDGGVQWRVAGELRERVGTAPQVWLHVTAHTTLPLTCQRCLKPVSQTLDVDRSFRFVANESEAAEQDADAEEDVLVLSRQFNVLELIEDELLLDLPVIARHEVCPEPLAAAAAEAEDEAPEEPRPNPFAALEALKKPGRRGH